ncbi:hypothetical protein F4604DRAFT_1574975 [Suillus subluteus]|nr:hypothetical protein F4604DRAFT_1574975 [Suillus subluteus]
MTIISCIELASLKPVRQTNYYLAQGRGIRCVVALFDSIENLITENDRRYEDNEDAATTSSDMEHDDYMHMLKMVCSANDDDRLYHDNSLQGADGARGDNTSKLKTLIADWVNHELKPNPLVDPDDKHSRRFINDVCGKLLCTAELDWNSPVTKAGIRDRSEGYIMMDLSFPAFLYEKYTANLDNLEEGLFKGKILVQGYKAVFTSPSSEEGSLGNQVVVVIVISYFILQLQIRFALSSVTLWRTVNSDFDYIQFWRSVMDFFERPPGREAQCRVNRLLEWWTRKVFGRSHREDLSHMARSNMSVKALTRQRAQLDDAAFDSN